MNSDGRRQDHRPLPRKDFAILRSVYEQQLAPRLPYPRPTDVAALDSVASLPSPAMSSCLATEESATVVPPGHGCGEETKAESVRRPRKRTALPPTSQRLARHLHSAPVRRHNDRLTVGTSPHIVA